MYKVKSMRSERWVHISMSTCYYRYLGLCYRSFSSSEFAGFKILCRPTFVVLWGYCCRARASISLVYVKVQVALLFAVVGLSIGMCVMRGSNEYRLYQVTGGLGSLSVPFRSKVLSVNI